MRWEDAEDYEEVRSNNPNGNPWELTGVANLIGDINNDAQVNIEDVIASLQILTGMPIDVTPNMALSDVNNDSKIGMAEAIYLLQKISGLRTK